MAKAYLSGLPNLRRKLQKLKDNTAEEIRGAMAAAAQQIVDGMKSLVPVDRGDLKASIGWTFGTAPQGSFAVTHKIGENAITIFAGDEKAYYARWVEFGTAPHEQGGSHPGTQSPGTKAQPFFFPTFRANKKEVKRKIQKAIRAAVQKSLGA